VTVAAEMDMYPRYVPWVFVTPLLRVRLRMRSYALMLAGIVIRRLRCDWGGRLTYRALLPE